MALLEHQHVKKADLIDDSLWPKILRPKMNCTVRFGKQFSESSPCLPGQQGTGQQGWYASGTLRKQFTKPTVQFILGPSTIIWQDSDVRQCLKLRSSVRPPLSLRSSLANVSSRTPKLDSPQPKSQGHPHFKDTVTYSSPLFSDESGTAPYGKTE